MDLIVPLLFFYKCNIMAEGFRFMPLGLVSWEPFGSAHRSVKCKLEHRCWRACGADVSLRDVTIAQMGKLRTGHRTRRVDFRLLAEALGRCRTRWGRGADEKDRIERMCISLLMSKNLYGHSMYVSDIAISWLWYIRTPLAFIISWR